MLSYVEGTRAGRPYADLTQVLGPGAVEVILREMPGWVVSGDEDLGRRLLSAGGRRLRHAHAYSRDLRADPAPPEWAETGYGVVSCDAVPAEEVFPAWRSAYPPGHPDHNAGDDATALARDLAPLLAGESYGPLLPCGGLLLRNGQWRPVCWSACSAAIRPPAARGSSTSSAPPARGSPGSAP